MNRGEKKVFWLSRKIFLLKLENYALCYFSTTNTCWQYDCKTGHYWGCKKMGTKKRILLSNRISEDCGWVCLFSFLWLLKASHPQIQTSRWLPEALWNQQAACVGHIILVSWPLDSYIDFYFIWVWSKAIGGDFKVTSDLWTPMMAFWRILSKKGRRTEMAIRSPTSEEKNNNDIICGFSWSSWSKPLMLYREEVIILREEMFGRACNHSTTPFCW